MDSTEEARSAASELVDLAQVPLASLQVTNDVALGIALRRIVPEAPGERVAVAAFNSSI